jgi:superfamily II DNA or RNA helicase
VELVLRDYQQECVNRVLEAYRQNPHGEELLVLATGAGKTVIFSHVIHALASEYGLNALIIAHRDELLDQAADKYRMVKPDAIIGKVGSGVHQYGGEVTVASISTISRPDHIKRLKAIGYGLIIIDEAHHQAADGYQRVLAALPDAFVLNVTATPMRLDKKDITGGKKPLYQGTILDMIRQKYLCDIRVHAIQTEESLDNVHTLAGDFNEKELALAVNTPARNNLIVKKYQEYTPGKRAVAFCVTLEHASALANAFNAQGIPAAMIAGSTPIEERQRLYKAYRAGTIRVLTNVMVLTEGWDEPLAEVCIFARPTQSQGLYIQMGGRVLRLAPGKKHATFLDITDNCLKHRIVPQNFKQAIGTHVKEDETLLEAVEREENEKAEREATEKRALIRKLNERRKEDKQVDLFSLPEWEERENGYFVLTVGLQKHRIAITPCKGRDGLYDVYARLAPAFNPAQKWLSAQPLDWCQQYAEKRARMLAENSKNAVLVDRNAAWRSKPIDPESGQAGMLRMYRIPYGEGTNILTKGQASDAIDAHKQKIEERKRKKAERAAARAQRQVAG